MSIESVGGYLKREREFRNISLQEISSATKIRQAILDAIEGDRVDSIAAPVFVRGYLKAYATYIGLDPNDVVLRHEAFLKEQDALAASGTGDEKAKQWRINAIVIAAIVAVAVGAVLVFSLYTPNDSEPQRVHVSKPEATPQTPPPPKVSSPVTAEANRAAPLARADRKRHLVSPPPIHPPRPTRTRTPEVLASLQLQLKAVEHTWLQIQIDEGPPKEILLKPGESLSKTGQRRIEMKIGNAGGIELTYNGRNLGKLGESGKVVYVSIDPKELKLGRSRQSLRTAGFEPTSQ